METIGTEQLQDFLSSSQASGQPERMVQELCNEINRLQLRRQLPLAPGASAAVASRSLSSGSKGDCSQPHRSHAAASHRKHRRSLFTIKQMRMSKFYPKMMEMELRAEYAQLQARRRAFSRFKLDQVQRLPPSPSDREAEDREVDAEHHMH